MSQNPSPFFFPFLFLSLATGLTAGAPYTARAQGTEDPGNSGTQIISTFDQVELTGFWQEAKEGSQKKIMALILQGSGNVGADGDFSSPFLGSGYQGQETKPSIQIAKALSQIGVPSFRYHKRGVEDQNELPHQTFDYLLKDSLSAIRAMRQRHPDHKLLIVGTSEGALLASHLAYQYPLQAEGLVLLAPPTDPIDTILHYQFYSWPIDLIEAKFNANHDQILHALELENFSLTRKVSLNDIQFPFIGASFAPGGVALADLNQDKNISKAELTSVYSGILSAVKNLMQTPTFAPWYQSLKTLETFSAVAAGISLPVLIFQGKADAQVNWHSTIQSASYFEDLKTIRLYENLGHGFSPMEGAYGEVKTSGPIDPVLLKDLKEEVQRLIQ